MGRDPPRSLGMLNANPAIEHRGPRSREICSIRLRSDRFLNTSRPAKTKHLSLFKIGCQKPGEPFCARTRTAPTGVSPYSGHFRYRGATRDAAVTGSLTVTADSDAPNGSIVNATPSWQLGQIKPTRESFTAVAVLCGRQLDRAVLIDDNREVVNAVSRMEIGTLLADAPEALSAGVAELLGIAL